VLFEFANLTQPFDYQEAGCNFRFTENIEGGR